MAMEKIIGYGIVAIIALAIVLGLLISLWEFVKTILARRQRNRELTSYHDIPVEGNLKVAYDMMNEYQFSKSGYERLLSASVLKLIKLGAFSIEWHEDADGKRAQRFVIHDITLSDTEPTMMHTLYDLFRAAAGDDCLLEPQELKAYFDSEKNDYTVHKFVDQMEMGSKYKHKDFKAMHDDAMQVFGLRKFLSEFALMDESGQKDVSLWNDYIVWATLFGISEQVIRDMKKLNPEYFRVDPVASQMADDMTLAMIKETLLKGVKSSYARSSNTEDSDKRGRRSSSSSAS